MSWLSSLKKVVSGRAKPDPEEFHPGADEAIGRLQRELEFCPVCGQGFAGHSIALFSHTALGERHRRRVRSLFDALDERRWRALRQFREWNPRGENAEVYVLRCAGGDLAVAALHSSPAPAAFKNVERCACVGGESARELAALVVPASWKPLESLPAKPERMLPT